MGARGPAPKNAKGAPKFIVCRPKKPSYLTDIASEYWDEVVPMLERAKVLNETHGPALTMLCEAFADTIRYREKMNEIFESGRMPVSVGGGGGKVAHPIVKLLKGAQETYIEIAKSFGMTPMSIGRVDIGEAPKPKFEPKEAGVSGGNVERTDADDLEDGINDAVDRMMQEDSNNAQ